MTRESVESLNQIAAPSTAEVFEAIHDVMHLIRSEQYRVVRDGAGELSHMEGKILGFLAKHPGGTLSELVVRFSRDKGQLARLIKSLKKRGFVSAKADPADRRNMRLHATPAGVEVRAALERRLRHLTKLAVRDVNAEERRELVRLLKKLRANLENA